MFVRFRRNASLKLLCVCQVLEECQSELYDLKFKQEGKQSAISDEVEILLTGMVLTIRYLQNTYNSVALWVGIQSSRNQKNWQDSKTNILWPQKQIQKISTVQFAATKVGIGNNILNFKKTGDMQKIRIKNLKILKITEKNICRLGAGQPASPGSGARDSCSAGSADPTPGRHQAGGARQGVTTHHFRIRSVPQQNVFLCSKGKNALFLAWGTIRGGELQRYVVYLC